MRGRSIDIWMLAKTNAVNLLIIFSLMSFFSSSFDLLELRTLDNRFRVRNILKMNPVYHNALIHINIDNYSKQESDQTLWPKSYYAKLINTISERGADVIVCDIMFVDWADTTGNITLINSIVNSGNVVSPILFELNFNEKIQVGVSYEFGLELYPNFETDEFLNANNIIAKPLLEIMDQSAGMGFVNVIPDPDGILRRIPLIAQLNGKMIPSLFLQSVCTYFDYDLDKIIPVNGSLVILKDFGEFVEGVDKDLRIPLDGKGNMLVNLSGTLTENYPGFGAWDLLEEKYETDFSSKLVIFADISSQGGDFSPTSLDNLFPRPYFMFNAASNLMENSILYPLGFQYTILFTLLLSILIIIICSRFNMVCFTGTGIVSIFGYLIIAYIMFFLMDWVFPIIPVLIPTGFVFLLSVIQKYVHDEKYRTVIESSLESYLSPVLMEKIKGDLDILKIGGERKRITVLFSDIVNFTGFSDEADPQEVQEVLERYFKEMTATVFNEKGIVDKYMGDGILAFFENIADEVTSAPAAVRCALSMQVNAAELDEIYKKQNRFPFAIRVGIATGYAKVGNIGPVEKIDYTIIGSVVNLASRIQGAGNSGEVIIDKNTHFFVKENFNIEEKGQFDLKGFSDPVNLFSVLDKK